MNTAPTTFNNGDSIAADLANTFEQLHGFQILKLDPSTTPFAAVVPKGKELKSVKPLLDEYLKAPERRRGSSSLRDLASFIAAVERFKGDESAVFADPNRSAPSVTAVFDYHPKGGDATKADWLGHRAVYAPQLSDEWKAWSAKNGQWMNQGEFAAFIEEHVTDLVVVNLDEPSIKTYAELVEGSWAGPSDMVSLSRGLQVNVSAVVKNAQTLNSGEVSITYQETHRDGAGEPLKVKTLFMVCIPVFYAGALYRIPVRLRYRVKDDSLLWLFQMVRPDRVFDDAFNGVVQQVRDETKVPTFLGTPEK